jgi:hypothetical protein
MKKLIKVVFSELNESVSVELEDSRSPKTVKAILGNLPIEVNINKWGQELYTDRTPRGRSPKKKGGDFMHRGYDQVMFINTVNENNGRVMVADFHNGKPPLTIEYFETWGQDKALDGWQDTHIELAGIIRKTTKNN